MKKIKYLMVGLVCLCFLGISDISAFSINAPTSTYINTNVTVKVEASGLTGKFSVVSSNQGVIAGGDTIWIENETIPVVFSAVSVGSATITVTAIDVTDNNYNEYTGSRSITINVIKKNTPPSININPNYSKNNYLKDLSIDGYEISFDKEKLEYEIELEPGCEKININASVEDDKASVKGNGEVSVSEGINTLNVVVIAENGNERTYVIKAKVEEKDPITVKLNKDKFTVVKKKELLGIKDGYSETTVKIEDFEIPALYNEVTKVTLIGLKDKDGNIKLYSYNSSNGEYFEYKEFTFDLMNLYIHENKKSKYKSTKLKINDVDVKAYELPGIDDYCLVYATNTLTGHKGYYLYDKKENSVQRYDTTMLDKITQEKDRYLSIVIVLSCVCFLSMLFLLIEVNRDNKRNI